MRPLTAVAILALAAFPASAADDGKDVAKQLEGAYEIVANTKGKQGAALKAELDKLPPNSSNVLGGPGPAEPILKSLVVKDGEIVMRYTLLTRDRAPAGEKDVPRKLLFHPSKIPGYIDVTVDDHTAIGIYEVKETDKGTELNIALALKGEKRPKDYDGDTDVWVLKLVRKKAK